jgi:Sec-independent protein translocase protein TatA
VDKDEKNSAMPSSAKWYNTQRLRLAAGMSLAAAMTMIALGLTGMEPYLDTKGASFWVWWSIVLLLVVAALFIAAFDMADLNRQLRAEKRELMKAHFDENFLKELEAKVGDKKPQAKQTSRDEGETKPRE